MKNTTVLVITLFSALFLASFYVGEVSSADEVRAHKAKNYFCNWGYVKVGDLCQQAPENSTAYGGFAFYCNEGYKRSFDEKRCEEVKKPFYSMGRKPYCISMYDSVAKKVEVKCADKKVEENYRQKFNYLIRNNLMSQRRSCGVGACFDQNHEIFYQYCSRGTIKDDGIFYCVQYIRPDYSHVRSIYLR